MLTTNPPAGAEPTDVTRRKFQDVEKYAGWLAKGTGPTRVRNGVQALGKAIDGHGDVFASVQALETEIKKLGSGGIARLLRHALQSLRAALRQPLQ